MLSATSNAGRAVSVGAALFVYGARLILWRMTCDFIASPSLEAALKDRYRGHVTRDWQEWRERHAYDTVADIGERAGIEVRPDGKSYEVRAAPTSDSKSAGIESGSPIQSVEGFWVRRLWLLADGCPAPRTDAVVGPATTMSALDAPARPRAMACPCSSKAGSEPGREQRSSPAATAAQEHVRHVSWRPTSTASRSKRWRIAQ